MSSIITVEEVKASVYSTYRKILESEIEFDWVLVITRGAMIPAGLLTRMMSVRKIDTICLKFYGDDHQKGTLELLGNKDYSHFRNQKVLVVDDILDSGLTLSFVVDYVSKFEPELVKTAVIYDKNHSQTRADFVGKNLGKDEWVVFDWEES